MNCTIDTHLIIVLLIMIFAGAFGGYLNYLHNFDTQENQTGFSSKLKYTMLGIGAAFLVPAFLKMISSNLACSPDNNDYLIFAGFCLTAAIFSRRFITTIGEKILEAAKKAEETSQENKKKIETTQQELSSAKERIEDVKLAVDIKNINDVTFEQPDNKATETLLELVNSYIKRTSVADYSQRLRLKAELGRRMGEIIVRNNLSKDELLNDNQSEGMLLALSYSIQLKPNVDDLNILNRISKLTTHLYVKYSILVAYDTLARNSYLSSNLVNDVRLIIEAFKINADRPLLKKIEDTLNILTFIN